MNPINLIYPGKPAWRLSAACAFFLLTASSPSFCQAPDPFERNVRLGRGINFGNALEAPKEGEWGMVLEEKFFRLTAEAGFHSVRLPIKWSAHATVQAPFTINAEFFNRVDWAVAQALKYKLAIILNIHHYDELMKEPEANKERLLALWKQIAERYKGQSRDVYFEILNEPNGKMTSALWNTYLKECLTIIRSTNPHRTVLVTSANWGNFNSLKDLVIPESESNVIVTVHYYNPFQFTHQGAEWAEGADAWLGTPWNGTDTEKAVLARDFKIAKDYGTLKKRPIHMGEFGAYSKADQASRARWTSAVTSTAEGMGFSWAYWEFGAGFGVYNRETNQWREDLKTALLGRPFALGIAPAPALEIFRQRSVFPFTGILFHHGNGRIWNLLGRSY